jgi:hypothetical protein
MGSRNCGTRFYLLMPLIMTNRQRDKFNADGTLSIPGWSFWLEARIIAAPAATRTKAPRQSYVWARGTNCMHCSRSDTECSANVMVTAGSSKPRVMVYRQHCATSRKTVTNKQRMRPFILWVKVTKRSGRGLIQNSPITYFLRTFGFHKNVANFLTNCKLVSFSRRTFLHGVKIS